LTTFILLSSFLKLARDASRERFDAFPAEFHCMARSASDIAEQVGKLVRPFRAEGHAFSVSTSR
jgi:hypothetical protein